MGYVIGDCSLGYDLEFEIPSNYESGSLIVRDGKLFNSTSGNITLYCSEYPDYSFRCPAMSGLEYRTSSSGGYTYVDLPLVVDTLSLSLSVAQVMLFGALLLSALLIICRGGAKRD